MPRLPNGDRAVVDPRKLIDYCLSATHPVGKHKARLFASAIGITPDEWGLLHSALLKAAQEGDAVGTDRSPYGQKYEIRFPMLAKDGRTATLLSVWIIGSDEIPRLVTCYPL
ncbi:MAG TPA: hypothetical protein VGN72_18810 [Tepidisphaeraceae bacterium]|jgi:hypothetical protein|nr:hypothetical protein [Tepidisphaeraceae bacterium]